MGFRFESFVNSEEYQTKDFMSFNTLEFESFVNSEEYQTFQPHRQYQPKV